MKNEDALFLIDKLVLPPNLEEKKLIGVGEVVHGSGGLHELAGHLIEKLILKTGSRRILIEAPMGVINQINNYLKAGQVVPLKAIKDLYFVWQSKEVLDFLNRIAALNKRLDRKIEFIGIDVRQPIFELTELIDFIRSQKYELKTFYKNFPIREINLESFKVFEKGIKQGEAEISEITFNHINHMLAKYQDFVSRNNELTQVKRNELILFISKLSYWLKTYYKLTLAVKTKDRDAEERAFVIRDQGMYDTVLNYLDHESKEPIIIWAHFVHLIYNNLEIVSEEPFFSAGKLLGKRLHDKLGKNYSLIALMAGETKVSSSDGKTETFIASDSSLERFSKSSTIIGKSELEMITSANIGQTDNSKNPLKDSYPQMAVNPLAQFDYTVIIPISKKMTLL
jgi:erythromycin esterase-like protein